VGDVAYPEGLLVPGERVLTHLRPHWRMLVVPVLVPPIAVGVGAWVAARASSLAWRVPLQIATLVVVVGVVGWFALAPLLRWRCTHFVLTDRRVLVREGVLSRVGIDVAGATVTGVRTRQNFLERVLGCGTLVVAVEYADDPWEFDGLAAVVRTAATLERVAEERGGMRGDLADDYPHEDDEAEAFGAPVRRRAR